MKLTLAGLFLAAIVVIVGAQPIARAIPKPEPGAAAESPAERLRKALEQPHSVDFQGHTLTAAIEALRDLTKLNIVLDRATLQLMDVSPDDAPVTLKLTQVKLKSILKTLLSQYKLTHVIDQDLLLITSESVAIDRQMRQLVSVDLEKVPLDQALKRLSRETATNLVLDCRQAQPGKDAVTLKLDDVPLEVAVRLMAEIAGLQSVRQANVIFVTTRQVAAELQRQEDAANSSAAGARAGALERLMIDLGR